MKKTALLILAAGASRRMGSCKQLLPWKNTTLIGNAIETALASKADEVFVVLGANFDTINNTIKHYPINILRNLQWEKGMGTSIAYGLTAIQDHKNNFTSVLISLADLPLVDAIHYNLLIDKSNSSKNNIIASSYEEKIGVPAIFNKKYFAKLISLNKDVGAAKLIKQHINDVSQLKIEVKHKDIDTVEDYKDLKSKL